MYKGEIWLINLDPTIGSEIKKTRPEIIVNIDEIGILPLRVIVPITEWKNHYSNAAWMVQIYPNSTNGLEKLSAADAFQIRSVSKERFIRKIGVLDNDRLKVILSAIQIVIGLEP